MKRLPGNQFLLPTLQIGEGYVARDQIESAGDVAGDGVANRHQLKHRPPDTRRCQGAAEDHARAFFKLGNLHHELPEIQMREKLGPTWFLLQFGRLENALGRENPLGILPHVKLRARLDGYEGPVGEKKPDRPVFPGLQNGLIVNFSAKGRGIELDLEIILQMEGRDLPL